MEYYLKYSMSQEIKKKKKRNPTRKCPIVVKNIFFLFSFSDVSFTILYN